MSTTEVAPTDDPREEQDDEEDNNDQLLTSEEEEAVDFQEEYEEGENDDADNREDDDDEEGDDYDEEEEGAYDEKVSQKAKSKDSEGSRRSGGKRKSNASKDRNKTDEENESEAGDSETGSDWVHFLKEPPQSMDDFMEDPDADISPRTSFVDIMTLTNLTHDEAAVIAEYIIQKLEEDLAAHVQKTGVKFPDPLNKKEMKRLKYGLAATDSASSFNSDLSDIVPGEPSKIKMFYEKGVSVYRDLSVMTLSSGEKVDKEIQVNLHRSKKKTPVKRISRYCQTSEMTFIPQDSAYLIFKQLYPQVDDFKIKEPPSRKASEDLAIAHAAQADPNIDTKRKGPQIISLSNKKQLLQPLMDDYYKDEKFWTGSRFVGEYKNRQFEKGQYTHPTGVKIESEFKNGHFETKNHFGHVSYPRGDTFEGEWVKGRYQSGQITFSDGLKFSSNDWKYCEPPDRRFKVERYYGIKPAGMTLFSDQCPAPNVPAGMYDVGDGFYSPKTGDVRGYDGFLLRQATDSERIWIEENCRKVHNTIEHVAPKFLMERMPGSYVECQKRIPLTTKRYH